MNILGAYYVRGLIGKRAVLVGQNFEKTCGPLSVGRYVIIRKGSSNCRQARSQWSLMLLRDQDDPFSFVCRVVRTFMTWLPAWLSEHSSHSALETNVASSDDVFLYLVVLENDRQLLGVRFVGQMKLLILPSQSIISLLSQADQRKQDTVPSTICPDIMKGGRASVVHHLFRPLWSRFRSNRKCRRIPGCLQYWKFHTIEVICVFSHKLAGRKWSFLVSFDKHL